MPKRAQTTDRAPKLISAQTRLTQQDVGLLLKLHEAGKTQVEIAHVLGCSQPAVSYWLNELGDTRQLATYTLRSGAQKLAERVVKEADVEQALEVLDRLDVANKKRDDSNRTGVQILIGMPTQPTGLDPLEPAIIDLSPAVTRELPG